MRSLSNTSQRVTAHLPPSYEEAVTNTYHNFQGQIQRLSSIARDRFTTDRNVSMNLPTFENSAQLAAAQDSSQEVHLSMPSAPPKEELPPSYDDAVKFK